jgi:hypothetical protein
MCKAVLLYLLTPKTVKICNLHLQVAALMWFFVQSTFTLTISFSVFHSARRFTPVFGFADAAAAANLNFVGLFSLGSLDLGSIYSAPLAASKGHSKSAAGNPIVVRLGVLLSRLEVSCFVWSGF